MNKDLSRINDTITEYTNRLRTLADNQQALDALIKTNLEENKKLKETKTKLSAEATLLKIEKMELETLRRLSKKYLETCNE